MRTLFNTEKDTGKLQFNVVFILIVICKYFLSKTATNIHVDFQSILFRVTLKSKVLKKPKSALKGIFCVSER